MYTFQALSEEDRKLWMDVMDGKEPVIIYYFMYSLSNISNTLINFFTGIWCAFNTNIKQ